MQVAYSCDACMNAAEHSLF